VDEWPDHLIRAHETFEDLLKIKFHYQLQRLYKKYKKKGVFYSTPFLLKQH
jgi:hypothetical protein